MAYIPNEWKDQVVQRPKTYQMNNNDDGSVTLIDSFGLVTELGTPVNQDYMNHIEQGIAGCAIRYYSATETFKDKEAVLNVNEEGDIELWQSLADNNLGNPLTDETKWEQVNFGGSGLPIGTVLPAMAAADYVPAGALGCDGTQYSGTQFPALWSDYLTASTPKLLTKNYTQYQADVTEYGKCAAFGVEHTITATHTGTGITDVEVTAATWETKVSAVGSYVFSFDGTDWSLDSAAVELADYGIVLTGTPASGDTVTVSYSYGANFKVPYITDGTFISQAMSDEELGRAYNAGLPNIEGSLTPYAISGMVRPDGNISGAFKVGNTAYSSTLQNVASTSYNLLFDASASNPVYGNSDTVQPEAVSLRWFVVVANAVENEAAMDWSQWASGLAGKANVDANNFSAAGQSFLAGLAMPSDTSILLTWPTERETTFTAATNGYFCGSATSQSAEWATLYMINDDNGLITQSAVTTAGSGLAVYMPVLKGHSVRFGCVNVGDWSATGAVKFLRFIPAVGSESEV